MLAVPRHQFVDSALVTQAYEDTSLPIGLGQTISKPSVVARMLSLLHEGGRARSSGTPRPRAGDRHRLRLPDGAAGPHGAARAVDRATEAAARQGPCQPGRRACRAHPAGLRRRPSRPPAERAVRQHHCCRRWQRSARGLAGATGRWRPAGGADGRARGQWPGAAGGRPAGRRAAPLDPRGGALRSPKIRYSHRGRFRHAAAKPNAGSAGLLAALAVVGLGGVCSRQGARRRSRTAARPPSRRLPPAAPLPAAEAAAKPLPGAENAGKPGYYTVKPGDTLVRIALDNGQNWRDLARWNNLDNPNMLEVGQVLRVVPPASGSRCGDGACRAERRPRRNAAAGQPACGFGACRAPRPRPPAARRRPRRCASGLQRRRRPPPTAPPRHAMPATTCSGSGRRRAPCWPVSTKAATRA